MKPLLIVTAVFESATGLLLVLSPAFLVKLLLDSPFETASGAVIARITGCAIISMAIACWLARSDVHSRATYGLIVALAFYNAAVVAVLVLARIGSALGGIGLWPAVLLHLVLGGCCARCLTSRGG